ncbi:MAG: peptidoglycan DD-metalloendopeptidase family protein [Candidatus Azambacteria bacterium]|nr:peptidoglycan DD-metalloendopeptidase family protein [Candidatus Azambacteria bacterium]
MKYSLLIIVIAALLFPVQTIFAQVDEAALREQISLKEEEIKKLEAEEAVYKQALSQTQSQSKTLKNLISSIESQINQLTVNLKITKAKISKTESDIKLHSQEIKGKEKEIQNRKLAMGESMKFLARFENQGLVAMILKSDKFSDFLSSNQYLVNLENGLYNNFTILAQDKAELESLVGEEKDLKKNFNDFKNELIVKNNLVQKQKEEKNKLLTETKNKETEYQKMISQAQIKQSEIQSEIFELEDKLRGQVGGVPPPRPGALAWPLLGRITQGYGPTSITGFYNDAYKFHNGIDLAAYYGAPIRAALDGVVAASGDNGKYAYGQWLAIRHSNGLTTLYAHFSIKAVSVGQAVSQGQIIGYEGSTGFVTGPHLHFTVYSTNTFKVEKRWFGLLPLGGSVNPFDYLL